MKYLIFSALLMVSSFLSARYDGIRHIKNDAVKQITVINQTGDVIYVTFKVPALHYGVYCTEETCFDKETVEIIQWRLKPNETQLFNLDWTDTKTNDGIDGSFAFNKVIYASIKLLNPKTRKWEKAYITIKDQKQYIASRITGRLSITEG